MVLFIHLKFLKISRRCINWIFIFRRQLIYCVEKQLLSEHKTQLLQKGLDQLLNENRRTDLTLLYTLFTRIKGGLDDLCSHFNTYIKVSLFIILNAQAHKSKQLNLIH